MNPQIPKGPMEGGPQGNISVYRWQRHAQYFRPVQIILGFAKRQYKKILYGYHVDFRKIRWIYSSHGLQSICPQV